MSTLTQQETQLAQEFGKKLKEKFPELQIGASQKSPTGDDDVWLLVHYPPDEETEEQIRYYAAKIAGEFLDAHGTLITPISDSFKVSTDGGETYR